MNLVPGQVIRWPDTHGPLYRVHAVEESIVGSEIPGAPEVHTRALLHPLDGGRVLHVHVVNTDNLQLVEDAAT